MRAGDLLTRRSLHVGHDLASSPWRLAATAWRRLVEPELLKKLAGFGALFALLLVKKSAKLIGRDVFDAERHQTDEDVRRAIASYLDGQISLEELDSWLLKRTWNVRNAPAIARHAELLIAEASRGDRDDLAHELRQLAASSRSEAERVAS